MVAAPWNGRCDYNTKLQQQQQQRLHQLWVWCWYTSDYTNYSFCQLTALSVGLILDSRSEYVCSLHFVLYWSNFTLIVIIVMIVSGAWDHKHLFPSCHQDRRPVESQSRKSGNAGPTSVKIAKKPHSCFRGWHVVMGDKILRAFFLLSHYVSPITHVYYSLFLITCNYACCTNAIRHPWSLSFNANSKYDIGLWLWQCSELSPRFSCRVMRLAAQWNNVL